MPIFKRARVESVLVDVTMSYMNIAASKIPPINLAIG